MSIALHWAALAAYLAGTVLYLVFIYGQKRALHQWGQRVLWLGFALHSAALMAAWWELGSLPAASLRQSLDVFSWALMGACLVINLRVEVMMLGALAAPASILLMLSAAVLPAGAFAAPPLFKSLWLWLHVLLVLAGYGLLAITFLGSVLFLLQERAIRARRLGALFKRLPSLSRLDELNQSSLLAGFTLMTVGLVLGAVYAQLALGAFWRGDPKEVWSLITWLLYAALLHSRLVAGWRGRRGAWLGVAAFGCLLFTFLGAGLWLSGYHAFDSLPSLKGR